MVGLSVFELGQMDLIELMRIAKADPSNNSKAMNELVRRYGKDAEYIARRVCFSDNDRVDAMNAALMGVVKAVRAHDGRVVGFKSYLRTTMEGEARRMSKFLGDQVLVSEGAPFEKAVVRDSYELPRVIDEYDPAVYGELTTTIGNLPESQQIIVEEMYVQDLTQAEIAASHGVTTSAISQRVKIIYRNIAAERDAA